MSRRRHRGLAVALGVLVVSWAVETWAQTPSGSRPRAVVLRAATEELAHALRGSGWVRWLERRADGRLEIVVGADGRGASDSASGSHVEVEVEVDDAGTPGRPWPSSLPLEVTATEIRVGTRVHDRTGLSVTSRMPPPRPERWRVVGTDADAAVLLAARVTARILEVGRSQETWEILARTPEGLEHRGRYRPRTGGGWEVDPRDEVDELAERDAHYARQSERRWKRLVVRGALEQLEDPSVLETLARVEARLPEWRLQVGLERGALLERPLQVVLEDGHEAHGRFQGVLGPVLDRAGRLHWVPNEDTWELEWGVARALVERAFPDLAGSGLEDGAALWLSRSWWGHDVERWRLLLPRAGVVAMADEILASDPGRASSRIFRIATAAALLDELGPGSLARRLERARRPTIERRLESWGSQTSTGKGAVGVRDSRLQRPLRGVSLAMHNGLSTGYHARALDDRLARLKDWGVDAVSIMPFAFQPRPDAPELRFAGRHPTTETDTGAIHAARRARSEGFVVLWKPHLWISFDSWPGDVAMSSEEDWAAWWTSYRTYVLHHAVLAEAAGAEILALGVELGGTVHRADEWARLIDGARLLFSGALTYAGNWHDDYERFPHWGRLDYVGIDAYFPLGDEEASAADLGAAARDLARRFERDAERFGRPVLLTEVGFAARRGAWVDPHREGGDLDVDAQARSWKALLEGLGHPDWLAGIFAWKVFSADLGDPGASPDFRILDRPAEEELRRWFRAAEGRTVTTAQ